eukprot:scaffold20417_cov106-Isochrysis_galbana.AAC.3
MGSRRSRRMGISRLRHCNRIHGVHLRSQVLPGAARRVCARGGLYPAGHYQSSRRNVRLGERSRPRRAARPTHWHPGRGIRGMQPDGEGASVQEVGFLGGIRRLQKPRGGLLGGCGVCPRPSRPAHNLLALGLGGPFDTRGPWASQKTERGRDLAGSRPGGLDILSSPVERVGFGAVRHRPAQRRAGRRRPAANCAIRGAPTHRHARGITAPQARGVAPPGADAGRDASPRTHARTVATAEAPETQAPSTAQPGAGAVAARAQPLKARAGGSAAQAPGPQVCAMGRAYAGSIVHHHPRPELRAVVLTPIEFFGRGVDGPLWCGRRACPCGKRSVDHARQTTRRLHVLPLILLRLGQEADTSRQLSLAGSLPTSALLRTPACRIHKVQRRLLRPRSRPCRPPFLYGSLLGLGHVVMPGPGAAAPIRLGRRSLGRSVRPHKGLRDGAAAAVRDDPVGLHRDVIVGRLGIPTRLYIVPQFADEPRRSQRRCRPARLTPDILLPVRRADRPDVCVQLPA